RVRAPPQGHLAALHRGFHGPHQGAHDLRARRSDDDGQRHPARHGCPALPGDHDPAHPARGSARTTDGEGTMTGTTTPAIEITGLRKSFGENEVLKGIDLSVHQGEVVCVIGPSGSGKSTLLRTVNRLEEPSGGSL